MTESQVGSSSKIGTPIYQYIVLSGRDKKNTQKILDRILNTQVCLSSQVVVSPTGSKGNRNTGPPKPQTPEDGKRPESLLGRFERRENLKKANTLPSSVTGRNHNCFNFSITSVSLCSSSCAVSNQHGN